jgi:carboxymethylenebutenolidase
MTRTPSTALLAACSLTLASVAGAQAAQPDYAKAMHAEHAHETATPSPGALIAPRRDVTTSTVTYATVNGKAIKGFLAKPTKAARNAPAIIVVHEWWGLNDNIKSVVERYAGEGYTALGVDLYGTVTTSPDSAMKLYQGAMQNIPAGEQNLAGAVRYLRAQGARTVGSVGYCFGGHWSLRTGLVGGSDVNAVVMYYGAPITDPAALARLKAPVLGLFGEKDASIPVDSVRAMERALKSAGKPVTIQFFAGAAHAFANPTGQSYNKAAADEAWTKSLAFFKAHLK